MKRKVKPISKKLKYANRIVLAVLILLIAVITVGSLFAMLSRREKADDAENSQLNVPISRNVQNNGVTETFTGIGRLRIPLSGKEPATLALTVSFPYQKNDPAFAEELASRLSDFRSIIREYFSALSLEKVRKLDENAAKTEILDRYNKLLHLGKIETLFFTDFNWY